MRTLLFVLIAAVLASTVASAENVPGVSGRWYLEGEEHGDFIQYLVDRTDDGKFRAEIRSAARCDNSKPWIETGSWTFRDGTLFNRTETVAGSAVDPDSAEYQDSFVITVIDEDHATALDHKTNITWATRRVAAEFRFPPLKECAV